MPPAPVDKNKKTRPKQKLTNAVKKIAKSPLRFFSLLASFAKAKANRATSANLLMICFIIFTSIGAGMIFFPAGWVVAGVCCGIFGFLLGSE